MNDHRDDDAWEDRQDDIGDRLAEQTTHNRPQFYSARQRVVVLTFETAEAARAWDQADRPMLVVPPDGYDVPMAEVA